MNEILEGDHNPLSSQLWVTILYKIVKEIMEYNLVWTPESGKTSRGNIEWQNALKQLTTVWGSENYHPDTFNYVKQTDSTGYEIKNLTYKYVLTSIVEA